MRLDSSFEIPGHGRIISALHYFTDVVQDYWHTVFDPLDEYHLSPQNLNYFYDVSIKATLYKGPLHQGKVYLFKGYDGLEQLHALEIAQYSLACVQTYQNTRENVWLQAAEDNLRYLQSIQSENGGLPILHKNPIYFDIQAPWRSGLCQAFAISAALRVWCATRDDSYKDFALRAYDNLRTDFDQGGCKRWLNNSTYVYEEYPRDKVSGVLNGHVSALLSVIDLVQLNLVSLDLLKEEFENLNRLLPLYESEGGLLYSLDGITSSGFYVRHMILQLKALGKFEKSYFSRAQLWEEKYLQPVVALRMLLKKVIRARS